MPSLADYRHAHLPFPCVSFNPVVQSHYDLCRLEGTPHKLAEMFAFQRAPAIETDTRWIDGHDQSVNPDSYYGHEVLAEAKKAGVNTSRAVYKSSLARYPGDPQAWVESRADCIRRAEALGLTLEGEINYEPTQYDPPEESSSYRVADDIVEEHYQGAIEADPSLAGKKDFKEELADTLSGGGDL